MVYTGFVPKSSECDDTPTMLTTGRIAGAGVWGTQQKAVFASQRRQTVAHDPFLQRRHQEERQYFEHHHAPQDSETWNSNFCTASTEERFGLQENEQRHWGAATSAAFTPFATATESSQVPYGAPVAPLVPFGAWRGSGASASGRTISASSPSPRPPPPPSQPAVAVCSAELQRVGRVYDVHFLDEGRRQQPTPPAPPAPASRSRAVPRAAATEGMQAPPAICSEEPPWSGRRSSHGWSPHPAGLRRHADGGGGGSHSSHSSGGGGGNVSRSRGGDGHGGGGSSSSSSRRSKAGQIPDRMGLLLRAIELTSPGLFVAGNSGGDGCGVGGGGSGAWECRSSDGAQRAPPGTAEGRKMIAVRPSLDGVVTIPGSPSSRGTARPPLNGVDRCLVIATRPSFHAGPARMPPGSARSFERRNDDTGGFGGFGGDRFGGGGGGFGNGSWTYRGDSGDGGRHSDSGGDGSWRSGSGGGRRNSVVGIGSGSSPSTPPAETIAGQLQSPHASPEISRKRGLLMDKSVTPVAPRFSTAEASSWGLADLAAAAAGSTEMEPPRKRVRTDTARVILVSQFPRSAEQW
ncbi:unnamed protein product, partial [Phaeothamnion confervicola]